MRRASANDDRDGDVDNGAANVVAVGGAGSICAWKFYCSGLAVWLVVDDDNDDCNDDGWTLGNVCTREECYIFKRVQTNQHMQTHAMMTCASPACTGLAEHQHTWFKCYATLATLCA